MSANKLYILVRKDLSRSQQIVQVAHAVAGFVLYNNDEYCGRGCCAPTAIWENEHLVVLRVGDDSDIKMWANLFSTNKINHYCFEEPHYNNEITAIAAHGKELEGILKDVPLL